ncbi:hypothetical protein LH447_04505 [Laribacter hongkongensis]|uniref:hypothetical protein n=1 Tax=Laribacter hongkongensis TaxID=168471 RepID=UPI001EFEC0C4|nr:hypothetical protein [Laribacter hongkongensis]MCG9052364.1 hypothetical protein [Laribacter hongkongensis]
MLHSLLPEAAIAKLIQASQVESSEDYPDARSLAVEAAIIRVRRDYPEYFRDDDGFCSRQ